MHDCVSSRAFLCVFVCQVGRGEACLWVEQWVHASKALCHWDTLAEYARSTDQTELSVEAAWRLQDWQWLKASTTHPPCVHCANTYTAMLNGSI